MSESIEQTRRKMSRVRASGSKIERLLGSALWRAGLRYRKQYRLPGTPDFVLVSARVAIFCDSNFWHGYRWGKRMRSTFRKNQEFWWAKIEANRARDRRVDRELKALGWTVLRFWEHEIKLKTVDCVEKALRARNRPV